MKKALWIIILIMALNITGCSVPNNKTDSKSVDEPNDKSMYENISTDQAPVINDIKFMTLDGKVINSDAGWFILDKQVKIGITLEGNCQMVDLLYTPAGSATLKLQQVIEEVDTKNNYAEYIWNVPDDTWGHFSFIAYNGNVGRRSDYYNVRSKISIQGH